MRQKIRWVSSVLEKQSHMVLTKIQLSTFGSLLTDKNLITRQCTPYVQVVDISHNIPKIFCAEQQICKIMPIFCINDGYNDRLLKLSLLERKSKPSYMVLT